MEVYLKSNVNSLKFCQISATAGNSSGSSKLGYAQGSVRIVIYINCLQKKWSPDCIICFWHTNVQIITGYNDISWIGHQHVKGVTIGWIVTPLIRHWNSTEGANKYIIIEQFLQEHQQNLQWCCWTVGCFSLGSVSYDFFGVKKAYLGHTMTEFSSLLVIRTNAICIFGYSLCESWLDFAGLGQRSSWFSIAKTGSCNNLLKILMWKNK